jgi:hypothetical protein
VDESQMAKDGTLEEYLESIDNYSVVPFKEK